MKSRRLAPPARLELTTLRLGGARSIQVSYGGIGYILSDFNICVKEKQINYADYQIPTLQNNLFRI